jgi:hypothetical protein
METSLGEVYSIKTRGSIKAGREIKSEGWDNPDSL